MTPSSTSSCRDSLAIDEQATAAGGNLGADVLVEAANTF